MDKRLCKLLLHCCLLSAVDCGLHSLEFLSTGRVQPGSPPSFDQVTVFDGVPISHCGSLTRTEEFKPSLQSHDLPTGCEDAYGHVIDALLLLPSLTNSTVAVVQRRRGCSQTTSGKNSAFEAWSVDGKSFMTFDPESQRWTGQTPSAVRIESICNGKTARNIAFSRFIRQQCPEMIQTIELKSLQPRTDLNIFVKSSADRAQTLLVCHVTTTDQSVSSVQLTGDGAPGARRVRVMGPVPGPEDGSVVLRLTAHISNNHNTYTCSAGGHSTTLVWDGKTLDSGPPYSWNILTIVFAVLAAVSTVIALSCSIMCLLRCVKKRARPPPPVDPQLMEQFTRMMDTVSSTELQSVVASYTRNPGTNPEQQEWWKMNINTTDQQYYDPEYFAHLIKGLSR